jgi:chromosomal replication initiation ATPase DnaA
VLRYQKGRGHQNIPRKIAMYLGQKVGDYPLNEIASIIGSRHYGRVSSAIYSIVDNQKLGEVLALIINNITNRFDPWVSSI